MEVTGGTHPLGESLILWPSSSNHSAFVLFVSFCESRLLFPARSLRTEFPDGMRVHGLDPRLNLNETDGSGMVCRNRATWNRSRSGQPQTSPEVADFLAQRRGDREGRFHSEPLFPLLLCCSTLRRLPLTHSQSLSANGRTTGQRSSGLLIPSPGFFITWR